MGRVGLVDLRDLAVARPWSAGKLRELLGALGWSLGERVVRAVRPMPVMAVVTSRAVGLRAWRGWLGCAERVVVILDVRGEPPVDAEIDALEVEAITEDAGADLVLRWDGSPASVAAIRERLAGEAWDAPAMESARTTPRPPRVFAPGPWIERALDAMTPAPTALARGLCVWDGKPVLADRASGEIVDLATGHACGRIPRGREIFAISPDGDLLFERRREGWTVTEVVGGKARALNSTSGWPIAIDPAHGLAAAGFRCTFEWLWVGPDGLASLAGCAHDWPSGHAKKLYGWKDNEPCRIELAADLSAYLSIFDVDAIVASSTPLVWREAGPCLAADWPPQDSLRRLLFVPDWDWRSNVPADEDAALEEDVRAAPPAVALGPTDDHRYAAGLDRELWGIDGERARKLSDPEPSYAVFDARHERVRKAPGRLLAGAGAGTGSATGALLVLDGDSLYKDDLVTGARDHVTRAGRAIDGAVPIPGTLNAVLYTALENDRVALRLV